MKFNEIKHIHSSNIFDKSFLFKLFELADLMGKNGKKYNKILENKIVSLLFYEPSTRTRFSFESAVLRLGGKIITTENASEFSSNVKGESIEDTCEMMNSYSDFLIIRHFEDNIYEKILSKTKIPYINAGSGKLEHPTQGLLDVYTIYQKFKRLNNLKILLCGDLLRGRTVDSLVKITKKFKNNIYYFLSPDNSKISNKLRKELIKENIEFYETNNIENYINKCDIFYMTRIQKERFNSKKEYEKAKDNFVLNINLVNKMKENSIILHPLPRNNEIEICVDENKRAYYFKQAENGLYIRMALLKMLNDTWYENK